MIMISTMNPALVSGLLTAFMLLGPCSSLPFWQQFRITWSPQNIVVDDATGNVQVSLTEHAGAQFETYQTYLHGYFRVRIKLVQGESAGTVSTFYLTSHDQNHDEIDFEFLGNETGQPYLVHTNVYANGVGNREQQFYVWFDPTADFHEYAVIWNHHQIRWLVDGTVIRIYKNIESVYPQSYPQHRPMFAAASIFEASAWATRGGRVPINWNYAPFVVNYQNFYFVGCESQSCSEYWWDNWWEGTAYQSLSSSQESQLRQFQQRNMVYNYCTDTARYPTPPVECSYNRV